MHACTSSALTWMIGTSKPFARSEAQRVERASSGSVVKPTWLFGDDVHRAADLVAVERLQVERLGDHPLAGERRVAVDHDRDRRVGVLVRVRALARGLRRARRALDDRRDVLQVARVGLEVHADRAARRPAGRCPACRGGTSRRPCRPAGSSSPPRASRRPRTRRRSCRRSGPRLCASTFSRPRWAMPTTTSCPPCAADSWISSSSIGTVMSSPSIENWCWPRYALCMKRSSASTSTSRLSSVLRSSLVSGWRNAPDSMCSRSHTRWRCEAMCSISYAIVPQ